MSTEVRNDWIPKPRKSILPASSTFSSDNIWGGKNFTLNKATVVQNSCATTPPRTTPNGFSSAAKRIVVRRLLSPNSAKKVNKNALRKIGEKNRVKKGLFCFFFFCFRMNKKWCFCAPPKKPQPKTKKQQSCNVMRPLARDQIRSSPSKCSREDSRDNWSRYATSQHKSPRITHCQNSCNAKRFVTNLREFNLEEWLRKTLRNWAHGSESFHLFQAGSDLLRGKRVRYRVTEKRRLRP